MDRECLWELFCKKNPKFADPLSQIMITGSGVRKLFDRTWDQAQKDLLDQSSSEIPEFLSGLFKKG